MKKIILIALVMLSVKAIAQEGANKESTELKKNEQCSKVYFDLSTGINNNGGLLGLGVDFNVTPDITINAGMGPLTTWGYKFYLGAKAFKKPCRLGWALGWGVTYSSGVPELSINMETLANQSEMVGIKCLPQTNFFLSAYHYWRLGKNKNRMYMQFGWSLPVNADKFEQSWGTPISANSATVLRILSPGGPIIGLGFSFGN